jgi:hypothetical protein
VLTAKVTELVTCFVLSVYYLVCSEVIKNKLSRTLSFGLGVEMLEGRSETKNTIPIYVIFLHDKRTILSDLSQTVDLRFSVLNKLLVMPHHNHTNICCSVSESATLLLIYTSGSRWFPNFMVKG